MHKILVLLALVATLALAVFYTTAHAQVVPAQNQITSSPYGGIVYSTSTSATAKLGQLIGSAIGQLIMWDGSKWGSVATSTLGFQSPITLTTTGTSGASTFVGNVLNIPQYQAAGNYVTSVSGTSGRISSTGGTTPVLDLISTAVTPGSYTNLNATIDAYGRITAASNGSGGGGGSATTTINGVNGPTFSFLTGTSGTDFSISTTTGTLTFNLPTASASNRGLLSSADWTTFNSKGSGTVTSVGLTAPTGLTVSNSPITTSGNIGLSLTSGYVIPLTASTTQWDQAYASTTALTNSYIRGLFSSTATGLTYTSGTGVFSLTGGYAIPTTAKQTEWDTAYTNRIASLTTTGTSGASTLISNVLNIPQYQAAGNYITALTGDVIASGPGSVAATLATVNSNVGTFGSASVIPTITFNGKGLATAISTSTVIAPAGTLTGTTLASNVVNSSLTSVSSSLTGVLKATSGALSAGLVNLASEITGILPIANGGTGTSTAPSSGQLLVGNGLGGYNLVATSSLGISASPAGSNGYVQFNNSGSFGGTADFFWDSNLKYLGIGTSTPSSALHISTTTSSASTVVTTTYDTAGSYTYTPRSQGNQIEVFAWGGAGGGGMKNGSGTGGGGGAGGFVYRKFTVASSSYAVTVASGGLGGTGVGGGAGGTGFKSGGNPNNGTGGGGGGSSNFDTIIACGGGGGGVSGTGAGGAGSPASGTSGGAGGSAGSGASGGGGGGGCNTVGSNGSGSSGGAGGTGGTTVSYSGGTSDRGGGSAGGYRAVGNNASGSTGGLGSGGATQGSNGTGTQSGGGGNGSAGSGGVPAAGAAGGTVSNGDPGGNGGGGKIIVVEYASAPVFQISNGDGVRFKINPVGRMAIGTSTLSSQLVNIDGGISLTGGIEVTSTFTINGIASAASNNVPLCINTTSRIVYEGGSSSNCNPSSIRFKKDVVDADFGLDELMKLRPVSFYFKDHGDSEQQLGFIAEEVELIDPRLVQKDSSGIPGALKLDNFVGLIVATIKDLARWNDNQDARLTNEELHTEDFEQRLEYLESENALLRQEIEALKNK